MSEHTSKRSRHDAGRRRRPRRPGLILAIYIVVALALAVILPQLTVGPTVTGSTAQNSLLALAAGMIVLVGLAMGLLFLMVQWAFTTFTPRLTLFRDDTLVWHALGLFSGTIVFALVAGVLAGQKSHVSQVIAVTGVAAVLASFAVAAILQRRALGIIQLPGVLSELGRQGTAVIDEVYPDPVAAGRRPPAPAVRPVTQSLSAAADGLLQEIDMPALVRLAQAADGTIRLHAALGDSLSEGDPVLSVSSRARIDEHQLRSCLAVGDERTFTQDPRYVLRILADIAARALSPAVNDPTTAADVLNVIERLLKRLAGRDLDVGVATDAAGTARVLRPCPGWEDFLAVGLDEIRLYATSSLQVCRRLASLLESLAAESPASRRAGVADQLERLRRSVPDAFPDPADQIDALVADHQGLGAAGPAGRLTEQR